MLAGSILFYIIINYVLTRTTVLFYTFIALYGTYLLKKTIYQRVITYNVFYYLRIANA